MASAYFSGTRENIVQFQLTVETSLVAADALFRSRKYQSPTVNKRIFDCGQKIAGRKIRRQIAWRRLSGCGFWLVHRCHYRCSSVILYICPSAGQPLQLLHLLFITSATVNCSGGGCHESGTAKLRSWGPGGQYTSMVRRRRQRVTANASSSSSKSS